MATLAPAIWVEQVAGFLQVDLAFPWPLRPLTAVHLPPQQVPGLSSPTWAFHLPVAFLQLAWPETEAGPTLLVLGQAGTVLLGEAAPGLLTKVSQGTAVKNHLPHWWKQGVQIRAQAGSWQTWLPSVACHCHRQQLSPECPVLSLLHSPSTLQSFVGPHSSLGGQAWPLPSADTRLREESGPPSTAPDLNSMSGVNRTAGSATLCTPAVLGSGG